MGLTQITTGGVDENINIDSNTLKVDGTNNRVGIGTSSPANLLHLSSTGTPTIQITDEDNSGIVKIENGSGSLFLNADTGNTVSNSRIQFGIDGSERLRIDSSGRLLVGTTSSVSSGGGDLLEVASGVGNILITSTNSTRVADQACGQLRFWGKAGANEELAKIAAVADGTHGAGDKPTRLTFSVTADGASSPTERMRITQSGTIGMGAQEPMVDARLTLAGTNDVALGFKRSGSGKFDNAIHCSGGSMLFKGGANSNLVSGLNEHMRINSAGRLLIGTTTEGHDNADNLTIADSGNCGITIRTGTTSTGAIYFSDATSGGGEYDAYIEYSQNSRFMRFGTAQTERMRIDSSGNLGISTTSPSVKLHVAHGTDQSVGTQKDIARFIASTNSPTNSGGLTIGAVWHNTDVNQRIAYLQSEQGLDPGNTARRLSLNPDGGNVGIGTTSPDSLLTLDASSNPTINIKTGGTKRASLIADTGNNYALLGSFDGYPLVFSASAGGGTAERARIDTSGRFMLGRTTATHKLSLTGTANDKSAELQLTASSVASGYIGPNSDGLNIGTDTAGIVFKTGVTGGGSVGGTGSTRLTIDSNGNLTNKSSNVGSVAGEGFTLGREADSYLIVTRDNDTPMFLNRMNSDGNLVQFYAQTNLEGTISVSGHTVSYNGGHLSRWSQLAGGAERTEILRGSVLSNLDEMCEWGEEGNEQLNRMKVSDVEGDRNVAGVFQAWDDDDDTYTNDFYCAMTGDFIIRIAQGTTVARGDLLMSAGDGTAKPQDDDIVRSKTIAKVTSTTVSTTYSDGSYCVPCVLMAC